ncbi:MAG: tautomerase family protein [Bacteroidales bacterium]|nr:tautomerase family protein [Bacteroidales bacterium]
MPLIKIEIEKGSDKHFLDSLIEITMNCVQKILKLPHDYKNIRLQEYKKGHFFMKKPYRILIEISMIEGRTNEIKKNLFQMIVTKLSDKLSIKKEEIFILINEQAKENWGIRGGISATEIFK